jgi:tetratricopeptide (TPR) repeat protein
MQVAARWMGSSIAVVALWTAFAGGVLGQSATPAEQWQTLNQRVVEAYQAGQVNAAVPVAEQALELARQAFGPRHPDTLQSMNNLAALYRSQGRYGEAKPLYAEALLRARAVLLEEFILTAVAWPQHSCLRLRMSADLPSRSAAFRKPPA